MKQYQNDTAIIDNQTIKFNNKKQWKLGYSLFLIISGPVSPISEFYQFYFNMIMKGTPWMLIHTLGNLMKGGEYVNLEKNFNAETIQAFISVATVLYELLVKQFHLKLGEIETLLAVRDICVYYNTCKDIEMKAIENKTSILDASNHPVHIVNKNGKLNPSALVPFCQIGEKYFGFQISHFSKPVCSGFEKKIFDGQICYSFNMSKFQVPKVSTGRKNGLKLFIDINSERKSQLLKSAGFLNSMKVLCQIEDIEVHNTVQWSGQT